MNYLEVFLRLLSSAALNDVKYKHSKHSNQLIVDFIQVLQPHKSIKSNVWNIIADNHKQYKEARPRIV